MKLTDKEKAELRAGFTGPQRVEENTATLTRTQLAHRVLQRYANSLRISYPNRPQRELPFDEEEGEDVSREDEDELDEEGYWGAAGAGILFRTSDRVLLMHRSRLVREPGTWGVVGGAVDSDEEPLRAARREAHEELGTIPEHRIVGKYVYKDAGFTYTTFIAKVAEDTPETWRPKLNWENTSWSWVRDGELKQYRLHFGVKPVLKKLGWK